MTWAAAINDETTGEVILTLARLSHASWDDDVRLVANTEDVSHQGAVYRASGFEIASPDQVEERNAEMRFVLYDVDASTLALFRQTNAEIGVEVSRILASDPDVVHEGPYEAEIRGGEFRFGMISGALTVYPVLLEPANATITFDSIGFPALA